MADLVFGISIIIVIFLIGYWMGFRACFDYLSEELEKYRKEIK